MSYYVYIIYSSTRDRFYIGSTEDVNRRLSEHNAGRNTSTKAGAPWILKYFESYNSLADARSREAQLKRKKSRQYLQWLIESAG